MANRMVCWGILLTAWLSTAEAQTPAPVCPCDSALKPTVVHSALRAEVAAPVVAFDQAALQIVLPERLVNRLLMQDRIDVSPVRDVITGADVFGRQQTTSRVQADFRPGDQRAEIHLVLQGQVVSETVGVKSQAAVATLGRHEVLAVKPVMFDGQVITTRRAQVWVDVHNQHLGAVSAYAGMPLFDAFARGAALSTAERQRPRSDAETADHLKSRIGPEFNQEVDHQLAQLNHNWRENLKSRVGGLWPDALSIRSTDSQLLLSADWTDLPNRAVNRQPQTATAARDSEGLLVRVHEDALNAGLRRLPLAGKTFSEAEIRTAFETFVTTLGGRIVADPAAPKLPAGGLPALTAMIRFADKDPVRIKLTDGGGELLVNASIEVGGNTVLAQDTITVPLSWNLAGNDWHWQPGAMGFAKAESGVTLAGMVETIVRTQLTASIPEVVFPRALPATAFAGSQNLLRLAKAESSSGWLTLELGLASAMTPKLIPAPVPQLQPVPEREFAPPRLESLYAPPKSSRDSAKKSKTSRDGWLSTSSPSRLSRVPARQDSRDPLGWFE